MLLTLPAPLQRASNYDERRVQRLQRALDTAAQHLARGAPPPVQGTAVFPPGEEGAVALVLDSAQHEAVYGGCVHST